MQSQKRQNDLCLFPRQTIQYHLEAFYEDPQGNREIPAKYGAEYVLVSTYELNSYDVDETGLEALGEKVFENREVSIYRLAPGKTE